MIPAVFKMKIKSNIITELWKTQHPRLNSLISVLSNIIIIILSSLQGVLNYFPHSNSLSYHVLPGTCVNNVYCRITYSDEPGLVQIQNRINMPNYTLWVSQLTVTEWSAESHIPKHFTVMDNMYDVTLFLYFDERCNYDQRVFEFTRVQLCSLEFIQKFETLSIRLFFQWPNWSFLSKLKLDRRTWCSFCHEDTAKKRPVR